MNISLPDFDVKKIIKGAGSTISRVVQLTEEKFGAAEKTELDSNFENLAERAECTKIWTEKIVKDTESILIPNPGNRVEDFIYQKIEKKKPQRLSNLEYLGLDMIEAGGDFGQDTEYGKVLIKVGQAEQKLGICERDFIGSAAISFTEPLKKFLDGEMKTITKEKGILESKRLDLDACKARVRKARSMLGQQAAERDLRIAQADFDRQSELTKILLEGISTSQQSHLKYLHAFVETQVRHYGQCISIMNDLQRELAGLGGPTAYIPINLEDKLITTNNSASNNNKNNSPDFNVEMKRARVLCSYDAKDHTELNLTSNEVIFVTECNPVNGDYMYGKQGLLKGLVPRAFLEMLDEGEQ